MMMMEARLTIFVRVTVLVCPLAEAIVPSNFN